MAKSMVSAELAVINFTVILKGVFDAICVSKQTNTFSLSDNICSYVVSRVLCTSKLWYRYSSISISGAQQCVCIHVSKSLCTDV